MSKNDKMKFIRLIEGSDLSFSDALAKYDVPRSIYYRWKRKLKTMGIKGLHRRPILCYGSLVDFFCKIEEYGLFLPEE